MEPVSLGTLIATCILGVVGIVVSLFVAFRSGHCKCFFGKLCGMEMDDDSCEESHHKNNHSKGST